MLFIFEPLLRELHQIPEDYYHFTPFSLKEILKKKFKNFKIDFDGGPFTVHFYIVGIKQGNTYQLIHVKNLIKI